MDFFILGGLLILNRRVSSALDLARHLYETMKVLEFGFFQNSYKNELVEKTGNDYGYTSSVFTLLIRFCFSWVKR